MQIVRLYDPAREPQGWMQIIRPTEFAAFPTLADSGSACDADGAATSSDEAICILFETLPDAEAFCRERVARIPSLRFDILDAAGLRRPPLFTIVHPSRAAALDNSPAKMRRNARWAIALFVVGPPLIWFDWTFYDGVQVVPTIVGINALLIAVRLLMMNFSYISDERARRARVAHAVSAAPSVTRSARCSDPPDRTAPAPP
jgi:hypothetical protein